MINKSINLKEIYPSLYNDVILHSFCPSAYDEYSKNVLRPALIVLPGGGYGYRSRREEQCIAFKFLAEDIATFILDYTIYPNIKYPCPLVEVYAAIAYIRDNYQEYRIDPNRISVIGFSAGGHLAASVACYHTSKEYADFLNIPIEKIKLNGCILSYPVISTDLEISHSDTQRIITENRKKELVDKFSIENHVTKDFPKTFIWHTSEDEVVSVQNSTRLANSLAKNKIFFELHIYPIGPHGLSLADESVYPSTTYEYATKEFYEKIKYASQWVKQAAHFIKNYV